MEGNAEGVFLKTSSNNTITNCNMINNVDGVYAKDAMGNHILNCSMQNNINGILLYNSSTTIIKNYSGIENKYGISIKSSSENTTVTNAILSNNSFGIYSECSNAVVTKSNINNNTEWGMFSTKQVDAKHNYWGSSSGPGGSGSGTGDKVNGYVIYEPWLIVYPYQQPVVDINLPSENALLTGNITIYGGSIAYVSDGVHWIDVSIDDPTFTEPTLTVNNITSWNTVWNSTLYPNGTNCSDGAHTIYARAWDNVSYSETTSVNITTDNTPPKKPGKPVHKDEVSEGYDNDLTLDFSWGVSNDTNFCRYDVFVSVNGSEFNFSHSITGDAATNYTTINGIDGCNYSIKVIAVDKVGLTNESYPSNVVVCDMTVPIVTITKPQQFIINITSFTINWTTNASDIQYYEVKINDEDWVNAGKNKTWGFENLTEGYNTLYVRGTDKAYNTGTPDSVVITMDTSTPTVMMIECSHPLINEASVGEIFYLNITYSENMDTTSAPTINFTPQLNGTLIWLSDAWDDATVYRLQYMVADVNEEQANVTISISGALDADGNTQNAYTEPEAFAVDTIAPVVTVTIPGRPINTTSFNINWTTNASDIQYYEVKINDEDWVNAGKNKTWGFENLTEGGNTLYVRATDNANNTGDADFIVVTVDTLPPEVTITEDSKIINTTSFTMHWSFTDVQYYEISTDNETWRNVGTNTTHEFTNLSEGSNILYVRATDNANNTCEPVFITVTVDTTPPTSFVNHISPYWQNSSIMINGTASDALSGYGSVALYYYSTDNVTFYGPWMFNVIYVGPWEGIEWFFDFPNGTGHYWFFSIATDNVNNVDFELLYHYYFDVEEPGANDTICAYDNTIPTVNVTKEYIINTDLFILHWDTTETDIKYYEVRSNDSINWTVVTNNSYLFINLSAGNNTLYVRGVDNAGNVGETVSINVFVDTTKPIIAVPEQNVKTNKNSFTVSWSSNDTDTQYYEVSYDGITWIPVEENETSYTFTNLSKGENKLYIRAVDNANNTDQVIITVTVTTPPLPINWTQYIIIVIISVVVIIVLVVLQKKGILKRKEKTEETETGKEKIKEEESPKEEKKKRGFLKRKKTEESVAEKSETKVEGKEETEEGASEKTEKKEEEKKKTEKALPEETGGGKEKDETETPPKEELRETGVVPVKKIEKPDGVPDCFGTYDDSDACKGCVLSEECKKASSV